MKLFFRSAQFILIAIFFEPLLKLYLLFALPSNKALKLYRKSVISTSCHKQKCIRGASNEAKSLSQRTVYCTTPVALVWYMYEVATSLRVVVPKPLYTRSLYNGFWLRMMSIHWPRWRLRYSH